MLTTAGRDRLIVALDVPSVDQALGLVELLDNVSFFKLGYQLFMTGELPKLLDRLREKKLFVDLKVPGDISNTIDSVVEMCVLKGVKFLTLSESMPLPAIAAAKRARDDRNSVDPQLLTVPFLSSLDREDLRAIAGTTDLNQYILRRAEAALKAGCDGLVASGQEIRLCREAFPQTIIVSPGIRPSGSPSDDHKRHTTPAEAIRLGANYLVVGRPIRMSPNPRETAESIIAEIEEAMKDEPGQGSQSSPLSLHA